MTDQYAPLPGDPPAPEQPTEPVNPAPVLDPPVVDPPAREPAPVEAPTHPDSVQPMHSDALPEIVDAQPPPTAGEMKAMGYSVPAEIPDDVQPHKYASDTPGKPTDPPQLVGEFPPHGVPRWDGDQVVDAPASDAASG